MGVGLVEDEQLAGGKGHVLPRLLLRLANWVQGGEAFVHGVGEEVSKRGYEGMAVRGYVGTRVWRYEGTRVRGYEGTWV